MSEGPFESNSVHGFDGVDESVDPGVFVRYLDAMAALSPVAGWKREAYALLEPRPGAVILDVGCGTGEDACALAGLVAPGGRVIGIDSSAHMVSEARRRAEGRGLAVDFAIGDACALLLSDHSVDGARAERVLQHLTDPGRAMAEMVRVVRPGGGIVLGEPDWGTLVIDGPDPALTARVLSVAARRNPSADAGRRLYGLLGDAGCVAVSVRAHTLILTDRQTADRVFELSMLAALAVRHEVISRQESTTWRRQLDDAGRRGRVFAALTGFLAAALTPSG